MLKTNPIVFAAGHEYQIMVPVCACSYFWVKVGDGVFYDHTNGVMRSLCPVHKATVPMEELDRAGEYTVCVQEIIGERVPYDTQRGEVHEYTFSFRPLPFDNIRAFMISDTHGYPTLPIKCAENFGETDLLIFGGDIAGDCGRENCWETIYKIASEVGGGNIPVIFARGNHEVRGKWAEEYQNYTPTYMGKTYYTVRLGSLWAMIMDCGEDKDDNSEECGGSVACHGHRIEETSFVENVVKCAEDEYGAEGVKYRFLISHIPFCYKRGADFNIEGDIYTHWANLSKEYIKPQVMLCGHLHRAKISPVGGELDDLGQPCTTVISSEMRPNYYASYGMVINNGEISLACYDFEGKVFGEYKI